MEVVEKVVEFVSSNNKLNFKLFFVDESKDVIEKIEKIIEEKILYIDVEICWLVIKLFERDENVI